MSPGISKQSSSGMHSPSVALPPGTMAAMRSPSITTSTRRGSYCCSVPCNALTLESILRTVSTRSKKGRTERLAKLPRQAGEPLHHQHGNQGGDDQHARGSGRPDVEAVLDDVPQ